MVQYRETKDSMGVVRVPETAYYGAQTQRAMDNFPISGLALPPTFIQALALVKKTAAEVNAALELLDTAMAEAIVQAAEEVIQGLHYDQFVVDIFQTGSGTSTNMNMNEVLACRANEILTGQKSDRSPVHPNDHVNQGQSSNDVIPTTIHLAACMQLRRHLEPALAQLEAELARQAGLLAAVRKIGRTHLQDAVPITLGDEFGAYARQIELARQRLQAVEPRLQELALGGHGRGQRSEHPSRFCRTRHPASGGIHRYSSARGGQSLPGAGGPGDGRRVERRPQSPGGGAGENRQ